MPKNPLIQMLERDLMNEHTHLAFYIQSAAAIKGMHRNHLRAWLKEQAESELGHVLEFSDILVSIGQQPACTRHEFPYVSCSVHILDKVIELEAEVVENYAENLRLIEEHGAEWACDGITLAKVTQIKLFYERQLEDSHGDLDAAIQLRG